MSWSKLSEILGLTKGGALRNALSELWSLLGGGSGVSGTAFTIAVVSLSAKMAKADGVVVQVEADAFERHFQVPPEEMAHVRRVFDLAKQDVAGFETYAEQIARTLDCEPALLNDVLECLFHIAAADGILHAAEDRFLKVVATKFGLDDAAYQRMRALFIYDPSDPYAILGASPFDDDATLKARYRQLVREHHPDRLLAHGVPKEFVGLAERKLASINVAWESIARERGL